MKKHKKSLMLLILAIITICGLAVYDNIHYSKKEILALIDKSNESISNIYIKSEVFNMNMGKASIDETYAKDNVIYTYSSSNTIPDLGTEIWDLNAKKRTVIDHVSKAIRVYSIVGERIS